MLRDDKSYPYIHLTGAPAAGATNRAARPAVTADVPPAQAFPRLAFHRGARAAGGRYFGPFPSAGAVRESLNLMQKLFRVRNCEDSYFRNRSRPCLQYQIGRCTAPCVGLVEPADYARRRASRGDVPRWPQRRGHGRAGATMERASADLEFERAAQMRDRIAAVKRVQAHHYVQGANAEHGRDCLRDRGGVACVSVLFFRNGVNLGSRDFFPRLPADDRRGRGPRLRSSRSITSSGRCRPS